MVDNKKPGTFKEFRVGAKRQHDNLPRTPVGPKIKAVVPVTE
ncbi:MULTISPECIES: hypothetical protein [unclassified Microcoleus]